MEALCDELIGFLLSSGCKREKKGKIQEKADYAWDTGVTFVGELDAVVVDVIVWMRNSRIKKIINRTNEQNNG